MQNIIIYYDDKCPICKDYVSYLNLKQDFRKVEAVGMRTLSKKELTNIADESSCDLNKGILIKIYDRQSYTYLSREKAAAFIGKYSSNKTYRYTSKLLDLKIIGIVVYTLVYYFRLLTLKIKKISPDIYT
jgi:predicted DCC family thiol-disulfide oxidoreductase YuxK